MTRDELTEDERKALESAIGAGWVEIYGHDDWPELDSACQKLGLAPRDWHGDPLGGKP